MKQTPPREACSSSADGRISRVFCNSMGVRFETSPEPAKSSHRFLDSLLYYPPI